MIGGCIADYIEIHKLNQQITQIPFINEVFQDEDKRSVCKIPRTLMEKITKKVKLNNNKN